MRIISKKLSDETAWRYPNDGLALDVTYRVLHLERYITPEHPVVNHPGILYARRNIF